MPPFRPRIYRPNELTPDSPAGPDLTAEFGRGAALGFDHVMVVAQGAQVEKVLAAAKPHGLAVILELSLDQPSEGAELLLAHPEWQAGSADPQDSLPDPRQACATRQKAGLRFDDPAITSAAGAWWARQLTQLAQLGVTGFCLRLEGPAPANFYREVIAAVTTASPGCRFLAWTPGLPATRVAAFENCGFDAAFNSSAWWDFRTSWLAEEAERLRPYKAVIALASVPGRRAEAYDLAAGKTLGAAQHLRALWLAAVTADGVLVSNQYLADLAMLDGTKDPRPREEQAVQHAMRLCCDRDQPSPRPWQLLSAPGAPVALLRAGFSKADTDEELILAINATDAAATLDIAGAVARFDGLALVDAWWPAGEAPDAGEAVTLAPAESRIYTVRRTRAASTVGKDAKRAVESAARAPRLAIEGITPCIDGGRFVAKRAVGDLLTVEADVFGEGHDKVAASLLWRAIDDEPWSEVPMRFVVNDRWRAEVLLPRVGRYQYQIEAWLDVFGAYRDELDKKTAAGQQVGLELREGAALVQAALARAEKEDRQQLMMELRRTLKTLEEQRAEAPRVAVMLSPQVHRLMQQADPRAFKVRSVPVMQVDAERRAAGFSSWYELFPRSMGPDASTHGTFLDVVQRLPAIRAMGFDTLYFPPIHPIGLKHRKGRNNTLDAGPGDPGSPYAIGAPDGGHDAIHAELGTLEDFQTLRRAAQEQGLELALDFAIQCSPDHPWLKAHPDWFTWRPDGTIRYAENPPKKYQDIVNVDFYADGAVPSLWMALRDVVLFWVRQGVLVFRVDNPHTKPMPFWEWLIGDVRGRFPDVIFLAEAFTRPKPMYRLAKLGFSQSYTYFTWRHTKQEFIEYLTELADDEPKDFFRPHFFVNTPDINPHFLQRSGRGGFVIRAALAATLSGLWGMYSGFELCEADPVPGKEEYLNSEKYELRQRDWNHPGNIIHEITLLNTLRRSNPALQTHLGVRFCTSSGEGILCFTKTAAGLPGAGSNILLIAICLEPHAAQECELELPLEDWGLEDDAAVVFEDLARAGGSFTLQGRRQRLRLDPNELAFSIWRLRPGGAA